MLLNRINPSVVMPGILVPQIQSVDFEKYIGSKTNLTGTAEEMLYVMTVNNINGETTVGQQWAQELNRQSYSLGQVGLPLYRINAYSEYDENEQAKFERLVSGVSLPSFLENLAKQAINQRKHSAILSGFDNSLEQGILANAIESTLPADSKGNTTITSYLPNELQAALASEVRSVMDSSYGMLAPSVFVSSTRVINYLKTTIISLLDSAQKGGVDSIAGLFDRVVGEWLGVGKVTFMADPLLEDIDGQGKDAILLIAPGMDSQQYDMGSPEVNQNIVGIENSISYNTMYDAGEGLKRISRPDNFGIMSMLYTYKMTPGATLRKEAVRILRVTY